MILRTGICFGEMNFQDCCDCPTLKPCMAMIARNNIVYYTNLVDENKILTTENKLILLHNYLCKIKRLQKRRYL